MQYYCKSKIEGNKKTWGCFRNVVPVVWSFAFVLSDKIVNS